jgi:membrane-bound lytic murein transglycosylase D
MANRINPLFTFVCMLVLLLAGCSSKPVRHDTPTDAGARQGSNPHRHYPMYTDDDTEPRRRGGRSSQVFPRPADIEPQVAFWRKVYSKWGRSQVAIHDKVHMDIIYDVFELPGEVSDILTASQKDYIQERFYGWKSRLSALEDKMAAGMALDADESELVQHIAQKTGHRNAIQGASERLRHQRGLKERFKRGLEISRRYDSQFRQIFRNAGLPEDLAYLPHVESSFQYNAHSSAGALGIWQFTSGAAKIFMNGDASAEARLDPINSTRGAARYLSAAYEKLGSWPLAVTSYNHGIGGMQRAKNLYGHDFMRIVKHYDHPQFGFASRNYYAEFLAAMDIASDPERYFAASADTENYPALADAGAGVTTPIRYQGTEPQEAQQPLEAVPEPTLAEPGVQAEPVLPEPTAAEPSVQAEPVLPEPTPAEPIVQAEPAEAEPNESATAQATDSESTAVVEAKPIPHPLNSAKAAIKVPKQIERPALTTAPKHFAPFQALAESKQTAKNLVPLNPKTAAVTSVGHKKTAQGSAAIDPQPVAKHPAPAMSKPFAKTAPVNTKPLQPTTASLKQNIRQQPAAAGDAGKKLAEKIRIAKR